MTRRITIAGSLLVALTLVAAVSSWAQQPPRMRAGGEGEIAAPRLLKRVDPVYPEQAKADKIQGSVGLEIVIDTEGEVIQTAVTKSVAGLDEAAVTAVGQWRYTPTLLNNQPVEVILRVTVNFRLN